LRTATHSFQFKQGSYKDYNSFGKRVLGEQWVSHWGDHKHEATRGVIEPSGARVYTGAGIVADSNPAAEYHETSLKQRPFLRALGVVT